MSDMIIKNCDFVLGVGIGAVLGVLMGITLGLCVIS
jgi:hypothetical protein